MLQAKDVFDKRKSKFCESEELTATMDKEG